MKPKKSKELNYNHERLKIRKFNALGKGSKVKIKEILKKNLQEFYFFLHFFFFVTMVIAPI